MPKSTKKPTREQLLQFVKRVARCDSDNPYIEDATPLDGLVEDARELLGLDRCDGCGSLSTELVEIPDEKICQDCLHGA